MSDHDPPVRMPNFNTFVALGILALGIAIWVLVPYQVDEPPSLFGQSTSNGISPKLFPRIIATGFILIGVVYAIQSRHLHETNTLSDLPFSAFRNLAVLLVLVIAYVIVLRPVGYVAASVVVATAISLYYGSRNLLGIAIVGVVAPAAIYFLFTRMLTVSLPRFPWSW